MILRRGRFGWESTTCSRMTRRSWTSTSTESSSTLKEIVSINSAHPLSHWVHHVPQNISKASVPISFLFLLLKRYVCQNLTIFWHTLGIPPSNWSFTIENHYEESHKLHILCRNNTLKNVPIVLIIDNSALVNGHLQKHCKDFKKWNFLLLSYCKNTFMLQSHYMSCV